MPEIPEAANPVEAPRQQPASRHHNPLIKPFVVLALPGMYLFYKYNQYKRKRKENATRRLAERELQHLHGKIEKLLSKLEENEPELATCPEEECVICIYAKATMETSPCGHQVVCRKCFVKTIQIAVSQRLLPLRCVVCRAKILRLKSGPMFPSSVSGYSMSSKVSSVPASDSLYSVSSGTSSISSYSSSSSSDGLMLKNRTEHVSGTSCCRGQCIGGAHPRQPIINGVIKRPQKPDVKMTLRNYCRSELSHINRLPPISEASPLHSVPSTSTRIRCAQKIVTQLEMPILTKTSKGYKYQKLPLDDNDDDDDDNDDDDDDDDDDDNINNTACRANDLRKKKSRCENISERNKRWWCDKGKIEEKIDNKKNEIMEKNMELKGKMSVTFGRSKEKDKKLLIEEENF